MKYHFQLRAIGAVHSDGQTFRIRVDEKYIPALIQLEGFSHLQILWWAHRTDSTQARETLLVEKLFKKGPDQLGIFATRAPARPNPIMVSTVKVGNIDFEEGIVETPFIDADDGTPVLDIKPYFPMQRVRIVGVPPWCRHWPAWQEEVAAFDWQDEINFGQLTDGQDRSG